MIREVRYEDLEQLLNLYTQLHDNAIPEQDSELAAVWDEILNDKNHHIIAAEENGQIISSCVCVIVPNLTRNLKPYALIENVITDINYRNKGFATACLNYARQIAVENQCYKMMLMTSSKDAKTLAFYQRAGYNEKDKTAFIQWL